MSDENVKLNKIRVPNLSTPSVYHSVCWYKTNSYLNIYDKLILSYSFKQKHKQPQASSIQYELSESAITKYETEYVIKEEQFKPFQEKITSEKRYTIIKFMLLLFYSRLVSLIKASKLYFCDMCLKYLLTTLFLD